MFINSYSIAAFNGHTDTCQLLLEKGCDIYSKDNDWRSPLHYGEYLLEK